MLKRKLLILGCSDVKRHSEGILPALDRYDGPAYRVIRKFLRSYLWPQDISMAVLSARYGLFGILKGIRYYDERMDAATARSKAKECSAILGQWAKMHPSVYLFLGKDYMPAIQPGFAQIDGNIAVFKGGIGKKLQQLKAFLSTTNVDRRLRPEVQGGSGKCLYFLPDWDDLLDPAFDFETDSFSGVSRQERGDQHCCKLMTSDRIADGILLSLAQQGLQKGPLRRVEGTELAALSPLPLRDHFGLAQGQYLFGDCGAFSYVSKKQPAIGVDQAVALYESYGFDFGASVDHIPVKQYRKDGAVVELTTRQRQHRVNVTYENAKLFIDVARQRKAQFTPVGIIQALSARGYAEYINHYYEFGYRHVAIGGLVPRRDSEIIEIVKAAVTAANALPERPWIHLFGIYRPNLQGLFRHLKIDSFDSASYFRKSWLRSDQNYLSTDGTWYAALRVPMTKDGRTRKRLERNGADISDLAEVERGVLQLLNDYGKHSADIDEVLEALLTYDQHLARSTDTRSMRDKYQRTLRERPWEQCSCSFCVDLGIHMLVFRGSNRNKRRGAHNTLMLYRGVHQPGRQEVSYLSHRDLDDDEVEQVIVPTGYLPIMTIHQAKGLEFDFVFVGSLGRAVRDSDSHYLERDLRSFRQRVPEVVHEIEDLQWHDSIRQHYVAFSRAKHGLILVATRQQLRKGGEDTASFGAGGGSYVDQNFLRL